MASKDSIISLPNANLRGKSKRVGVITPQIRQIIEDMKSATLDWEASRPHEVGVALAAIQIDQPYRIIVIRNDFDNKEDKTFHVFINPEVVKTEGDLEEDFEGCLSVPDFYGKVPRYNKIRMRALSENGQELRVKAEGFLARVLQHEVDHCNGLVFVDHIHGNKDAFFKLTSTGKLKELPYEQIEASGILQE